MRGWRRLRGVLGAVGIGCLAVPLVAQQATDRLREFPGYEAYARRLEAAREPAFVSGALNVLWSEDSRSVTYAHEGRRLRFTIPGRVVEDAPVPTAGSTRPTDRAASTTPLSPGLTSARLMACPPLAVDRGRQRVCEASPDGTYRAFHRDRNLFVSRADGSEERPLTTDGDTASRIKYGTASWVYGEELDQTTAIWWSPDSQRVAFYRFDESGVRDYYLTVGQTTIQTALDVEAYPKAGTPNPVVDILVYDRGTGRTTRLDIRGGAPFSDDVVGHYAYAVQWAPDGTEIRLFRTDRRQQVFEFAGCDPRSGACRVIVRETWPTGWVEPRPLLRPLRDGERFLWASHRTGWRNFYLYDWSGRLLNPVTRLEGAEAGLVVRLDEAADALYYMANDGATPLSSQFHRVRLDGTGDRRLTDPAFTHAVSLAPDAQHFVDVYQRHDRPPASRVVEARGGQVVAELAASDLSAWAARGYRPGEVFSYLAADGRTRLYGSIAFPPHVDPGRRYPVVVMTYAGPESSSFVPTEAFATPPALTEWGFLVVTLTTRAAPGFGRRALDTLYGHMGRTEVDDLAAGVRALGARPDVDRARIAITGSSYGGYAAVLALLRYPDLFAAAAASSPVSDWRHYDTIYTERYMGLPQTNAAAYDAASALTYVDRLRGRLILYFGTADNNVHPSNSLQLIDALTRAGKSFEVQVGADEGHGALPTGRQVEFLVENLILRPERLFVKPGS